MPLDLYGPLTTVILCALVGATYWAWRADRPHLALTAIVLIGAAFRIYMGVDRFLHPWDERFHALVARNLVAHPFTPTLYDTPILPYDYRDWAANHIWVHKPPLALWAAALSMAVFGFSEIAFRVSALLASLIAIAVTYRVAVMVFDTRTALLAALFHAGNGFLILLPAGITNSDAIDNMFVLTVELGVLAALVWSRQPNRWRGFIVGVAVGCAVLTKLWPAFVIFPLQAWLGYAAGRSPRALFADLLITTVGAAAIAGPWFIYVAAAYPKETAIELLGTVTHMTEAMDGQAASITYYLANIPRFLGELVYVPMAWFLWRAVTGRVSAEARAIALWLGLPIAVFSLATGKAISYLAIAMPAVFMAEAAFVVAIAGARPPAGWLNRLRVAFVVLLLVLPFRFALERLNPLHGRIRQVGWAESLKALKATLPESAVLFGTAHPIEAMFTTGHVAYEFLPNLEQRARVRQAGKSIAICAERPLPPEIADDATILRVVCGE